MLRKVPREPLDGRCCCRANLFKFCLGNSRLPVLLPLSIKLFKLPLVFSPALVVRHLQFWNGIWQLEFLPNLQHKLIEAENWNEPATVVF